MLSIVESGRNGMDGASGNRGSPPGGHGSHGQDGEPGDHARDIKIQLMATASGCAVSGTHSGEVPFGAESRIYLEAHGGKGGDGGRGGDGAVGYTGQQGRDATRHSRGGDGGRGGPGGNGGDGGNGARGGDGGHVRVAASDNDMDLFMLNNQCDIRGGRLGHGGSGGSAGPGGPGGPGGRSHEWEEEIINGDRVEKKRCSQPGGNRGPTGPPGSRGRDGRNSTPGRDGSFMEVVEYEGGQKIEYPWRYVAKVGNLRLLDASTEDGIFEPGEACKCWYDITNTGPMPTPKVQRIFCSFFQNDWLHNPTLPWVDKALIKQGETRPLTEAINYNIKYYVDPPPNELFFVKSDMVWASHVERVGKFFTAEELGPHHVLPIRYPTKLSPTHGPATITKDEEGPLTICCHNLCTKALGRDAGRVQRIRLELVTDHDSMTPLNNPNFAFMVDANSNPIDAVDDNVLSQESKSNRFESAMIRFGRVAKQYSRVVVGAQLFLGDINDFQRESRIQRMSVEIQLAAYYARSPDSQALLITNHQTTFDSFNAWKDVFGEASINNNVWNATLHGGLTFEQDVNGSKLHNDMRGNAVIVENNNPKFLSTLKTERNEDDEYTMDTVAPREVVVALRDKNMGFAVIGRPINGRMKLLPTDGEDVPFPLKPEGSRSDDDWISLLSSCPVTQRMNYGELHESYKKAGMSNIHAWQLVHGTVISCYGEALQQVKKLRFPSLKERLEAYFAYYAPFISPTTITGLTNCNAGDDVILGALSKVFGPEPEYSNKYEYVSGYTLTKMMNLQKAKAELFKAGNKSYERVAQHRPQWKFVMVFDIAPHFCHKIPASVEGMRPVGDVPLTFVPQAQRPMMKKICFGRLHIARSGNRFGATVQNVRHDPEEKITAEAIRNPLMRYAILKASPFHHKLRVMSDSGFNEFQMNVDTLKAAFLSDLIEEQVSMRRDGWSGPIADDDLLEHTPNLCAFVASGFTTEGQHDERTQHILLNVGVHLHYLLGRWVAWHDKCMIRRRHKALTRQSHTVLETFMTNVCGGNASKWKEMLAKMTNGELKDTPIDECIESARRGFADDKSLSNTELWFRVVHRKTLMGMRAKERPPVVVTNRWVMESNRDRKLALHKLRSEFGPEGEVVPTTSREKQDMRLDFLTCQRDHCLRDIDRAACMASCGICEEPMKNWGGQYCDLCNWYVCSECATRGNTVRWNPKDEVQESV